MAKKESQGSFNIVRPLQSACRRISTGLIAPVLRGLKGQRAETSRQRTEGLAVRKERKCSPAGSCVEERSLSDVGFSPPPSPVEVRQRQKTSSCSPILGRRRRRLYQPLFPKTSKVTVLGQGGVGKSALIVQFISHRFLGEYDPNIEDTYSKHFSVDQEPARLEILDTAGQSEDSLSTLRERYEITSGGFIVVYSITDSFSYRQAQEIIQRLRKRRRRSNDVSDIVIALVGNKVDLLHQRQVSTETARIFAEANGCLFMEVSAADGHLGIDGVFTDVIRKVREMQALLSREIQMNILPTVELLKKLDVTVREVYSHEDLSSV